MSYQSNIKVTKTLKNSIKVAMNLFIREFPYIAKTAQAIASALAEPPEMQGKTLLLKAAYTWDLGNFAFLKCDPVVLYPQNSFVFIMNSFY